MTHPQSRAESSFKLSVTFGILMLGLGACQPLVPPTITAPVQTASQPVQPGTPALAEATTETLSTDENTLIGQSTEPASEAAETTTAALATPIAVTPPPKPPEITDIDPRSFLSKSVQEMTNILGEADFMRVEGQIGIWQFRQENCVVDFFFNVSGADNDPSRQLITALDIRGRFIGQPLDEKGCRKELYQRRL